MQSKLAKSIMVMSLSLVISTSTINPVHVEAKTLIDSFMEAVQGEEDDSLIDLDAEVDKDIKLEIIGPSCKILTFVV